VGWAGPDFFRNSRIAATNFPPQARHLGDDLFLGRVGRQAIGNRSAQVLKVERQEFAAAVVLVEDEQDLLLAVRANRVTELNANVDVHTFGDSTQMSARGQKRS
jgi:hypothetical protein